MLLVLCGKTLLEASSTLLWFKTAENVLDDILKETVLEMQRLEVEDEAETQADTAKQLRIRKYLKFKFSKI